MRITVAVQGIIGAINPERISANVAIGTFHSPVSFIGIINNKIPRIDGIRNNNHVDKLYFFISKIAPSSSFSVVY